jgi:5-methylcytosine-specific restriction endonuclease McrA
MGIEKSIEAGKRNFAEANARKTAACAPRRAAEQLAREERQRRILIKRLHRAMKSYAKAVEKEILKNQHGTSIGDYDRCRKNNGIACKPCKAGAAAYMRVKNKEPKYKAKEKEYYKNNPHKRPPKSRDRARIKGAKRSYYTRQHIFDRDGYDCYICNTPVDLNAPHVQGQPGWETYPHVEHVVPLSLGGDDTLQNVKIAHAKCNIDKGTRLLATA